MLSSIHLPYNYLTTSFMHYGSGALPSTSLTQLPVDTLPNCSFTIATSPDLLTGTCAGSRLFNFLRLCAEPGCVSHSQL